MANEPHNFEDSEPLFFVIFQEKTEAENLPLF
jgi:hypothetical protein